MTKLQRLATLGTLLVVPALLSTGCFADPKAAYNLARTQAFDLYTLGEDLERAGDPGRALDHYLQAIDLSPRPAFFYKAGHLHHELGRPDQAVFFFDRALDLAPDYELARTEKAVAQLKLRETELLSRANPPAAPTAPVAAVVAPPSAPAPTTTLVTAAAPVEPAAANVPDGQGTDPQLAPEVADAPLPAATGALPYESLDRDALRSALFPASAPGERSLAQERDAAMAAIEAGRWDEAVRRWGYVLSQTPDDPEARREHARALHRSGRTLRALEEFQQAATLSPNDPETLLRWANALAESGDKAAAEANYRRALELRPEDNRTRNNLAALCLDQARWEEAAGLLEQVVAADPEFAAAHLNLAIALGELNGERTRRVELLDRYLQLGGARRAEARRMLNDLKAAKD